MRRGGGVVATAAGVPVDAPFVDMRRARKREATQHGKRAKSKRVSKVC